MKQNKRQPTPPRDRRETFEELEKLAHDTSDIRPLSPAMRRRWEAMRRAGTKPRVGRPPKDPQLKSRIVPISIDPALLAEVDRYAKSKGVTRSARRRGAPAEDAVNSAERTEVDAAHEG